MSDTKSSVLQAALPLFVEKGFLHTSLEDAAVAAGIPVGELKKQFPTTDELFMELIKSMDNQKFDNMDSYEQTSESCWEQVVKFVKLAEHQIEIVNEKSLLPALMEFNMTSWRQKKNQDFIQWRYDVGTEEMIQFFKKGIDSGEFRPKQPIEAIVGFFGSQVNGLAIAVQWAGKEKIDYKKQIEMLLSYLQDVLDPVN
ncbi:TetR family transcriptional regulator [Paenibacillus flagellatus]|uniref:HTH tetR-type domain-containing protein n=1 Tax=Paenibacillus flagellatus TaxID=2211139 RepID=A0A2V5KBX3_9BACL|nr:TetR family transcriptional regulator [Paenibacillus flagellatus]PYI57079.1 hypothetical protein DLM86_01115 [Paenibacillus flagellatus]